MAAPGQSSAADHLPVRFGHGSAAPPDPAAAIAQLQAQASALTTAAQATPQRLDALEALRGAAIEATRARRALYFSRPVPLAAAELRAWQEVVSLWHALHAAYTACAHSDPGAALAAQRALDSLGRVLSEHTGAYRTVPDTVWKDLHAAWRRASEAGLADTPVHDPHAAAATTTCRRTYLAAVLLHCAHPYLLAGPQLQLLAQWLPQWLELVDVCASPPVWASRSPLAIDLDGAAGARLAREVPSGEGVRFLDTSALGMRLRELADCARNGRPAPELQTPAAPLPPGALERLLTHLYVQWCSAGSAAVEERAEDPIRAQVGLGMHAVHFQISGRAFRQPATRYTREEEHDLATFGYITERTEQRLLTGRSAASEPWELAGRNASTLSLRRGPDHTAPIAHGQLLAVRTSSIDAPSLGTVQRLRVEADGWIHVGVRLIRGEARGVAVRAAGNTLEKFERALLIEDESQRGPGRSLLVASGRFAPGARVELGGSRSGPLTLGAWVERGLDFDRLALGAP